MELLARPDSKQRYRAFQLQTGSRTAPTNTYTLLHSGTHSQKNYANTRTETHVGMDMHMHMHMHPVTCSTPRPHTEKRGPGGVGTTRGRGPCAVLVRVTKARHKVCPPHNAAGRDQVDVIAKRH